MDEPGDHPARRGEDLPPTLRVPDDASSLEADRLAWLAEVAAARGRPGVGSTPPGDGGAHLRRVGPVVVLFMVLTSLVAVLAVWLAPRPQPRGSAVAPAAVPALTVPTAAGAAPADAGPDVEPRDGPLLGRRMPDLRLASEVGPVSLAGLRPALLLLVPPGCDCTAAVDVLYRQAQTYRFATWLVGGPGTSGTELVRTDVRAASGGARWARDPDGALGRTLRADGLTLAVVTADGVLAALQRRVPLDAAAAPALEPVLALLGPEAVRPR